MKNPVSSIGPNVIDCDLRLPGSANCITQGSSIRMSRARWDWEALTSGEEEAGDEMYRGGTVALAKARGGRLCVDRLGHCASVFLQITLILPCCGETPFWGAREGRGISGLGMVGTGGEW